MKRALPLALAIAPALLLATASSALSQTTVTLQASMDNTLYESATGANSNGAGDSGFTGSNTGGSKRRYLVKFDVAGAIPSGASITSARIEYNCTQVPGGSQPDSYGTHRMLADWGEGTSTGSGQGGPSTAGDATWIHSFFPATNWPSGNPGGDFFPTPSTTTGISSTGLISLSTPQLAAEVQGMLDTPANNHGWMIKAAGEGVKTARKLASREHASAGLRPTLTVTYDSGPSTFCDPANNNSTGSPAVLSGSFGSGVGSDLHLSVSGGPLPLGDGTRMLGYFLVGNMDATPGITLSDGQFCLVGAPGASFGRYNVSGTTRNSIGLFDAAGDLENFVGTGGVSGYGFDVPSAIEIAGFPPTTIMAGDTYHFQAWYRDTLAGAGHSNFSNGLSVTF